MTSVVASRYAVVIHAMCETPPRSPTMVGIAVETIVWSRAAMSMPASRAPKITLIRRRVRTIGVAPGSADSVVGASNCTPHELDGATGAWCRVLRGGRRCPPVVRGSAAGRRREAGGQQVPGLVEEI